MKKTRIIYKIVLFFTSIRIVINNTSIYSSNRGSNIGPGEFTKIFRESQI